MLQPLERRARALSGIPQPAGPSKPWWKRLLTSTMTWVVLGATIVFAGALAAQYFILTPDTVLPDGKVAPGINNDALIEAAKAAFWTLLVWSVLFWWLDRYSPQRWSIRYLALGWGACVSTLLSLVINTWAGNMMSVQGQAVDTGARPAIFIAPFSEEATKASVLFLLAMSVRYRLVSRLSVVSLAGLSALGFAFVENIIYYGRAIVFASTDIETGDPDKALAQMILLRGVMTSFAHPLFTMMTALGLAVALRTRSKTVRIVAPLAGFLAASLLHMLFNGLASLIPMGRLLVPYISVLTLLASMVFLLIMTIHRQSRLIRWRLTDFERMGWLVAEDAHVLSGPFRRLKLLTAALFRPLKVGRATRAFVSAMTELAYLRDGTVRGIIDQSAVERERELLNRLAELRPLALTRTNGLKTFVWPFAWRFRWPRASRPITGPSQTTQAIPGLFGMEIPSKRD